MARAIQSVKTKWRLYYHYNIISSLQLYFEQIDIAQVKRLYLRFRVILMRMIQTKHPGMLILLRNQIYIIIVLYFHKILQITGNFDIMSLHVSVPYCNIWYMASLVTYQKDYSHGNIGMPVSALDVNSTSQLDTILTIVCYVHYTYTTFKH